MADLPVKYVKDKDGRFIPITSPKAVIDENGRNITEVFATLEALKDAGGYTKLDSRDIILNELPTGAYIVLNDAYISTSYGAAHVDVGAGSTIFTTRSTYQVINSDGSLADVHTALGTINANAVGSTLPLQYNFYDDGEGGSRSKINVAYNYVTGSSTLLNYYTKNEILNALYPIGTIYLTTSTNGVGSSSPASWLGGTWERLPEGYALWTASSGAGGTINAGLPEISGTINIPNGSSQGQPAYYELSGAYSVSGNATKQGNASGGGWGGRVHFNASRSNSIYGNSTTVQPPAYKVYAWRRTS